MRRQYRRNIQSLCGGSAEKRFFQETSPSGRGERSEECEIVCITESGDEVIEKKEISFSSLIDEVWLPSALRMGIPVDVFWNLNPKYMYMYQDNFIKEKEEKLKMLDVAAFYQGLYVKQAIASCFNKSTKYPKIPFSLIEKENSLSPEEKFKLWIEEYNRRFDENQGIGVS